MTTWQEYSAWRRGPHHTAVGNIKVNEKVWSPQLHNNRNLFVYLPPSYRESTRRYPVLYMHDGQNLFDRTISFADEWGVDETMEKLSKEGIEAIVVGIANAGGQRLAEYSPFADVYHGAGRGEQYLDFVVETVKRMIDDDFRTLPGREHTGLMGSSMGGLITLYGYFCRESVFGFAGVMSPSLWFAGGAMLPFIGDRPYIAGKIYLDVGTRELGGKENEARRKRSRRYYASVRRLKRILVKKGYRPVHELYSVEDKFAGHDEPSWGRRLPNALRFLLAGRGENGA